ncbi:MAG: 3'-5' exonuclease, partial [Nanoarchaeota archaeon]
MIIYIKKENDKLKIITPSQKKIINFNDWFFIDKSFFDYYNGLKEKLEPFFKEEKEMDFKNKKLITYYYEFDLQKKKVVDKIIKEEKKGLEKINKELKEKFKKSIFERDISVETKFFFFNEAINNDELKKAKKVAFDLEIWSDKVPNPNKDPIVLASFYGDNIAKVLVYDNEDKVNLEIVKKINEEKGFNYEIEFVKSEKEMIIKIIETLKQFDIIFSYNGDNFDFYFLKE